MSKERPILFQGAMVRAILDGSKTQTRRGIKPSKRHPITFVGGQGDQNDPSCYGYQCEDGFVVLRSDGEPDTFQLPCPYGQPGDRLWVRETWAEHPDFPGCRRAIYRADPECEYDTERWRPSIHMPRWASRILLEIVSVRVERLQDISDADAQAEGCPCYVCGRTMDGLSESDCHCFHRKARASDYRNLWESINGAGSWEANPWVWCVEFRRISA